MKGFSRDRVFRIGESSPSIRMQMPEERHPARHSEIAGDKTRVCGLGHRVGKISSKYDAKKSTWNGARQDDVISLALLHPDGRGQQETERRLDDVFTEHRQYNNTIQPERLRGHHEPSQEQSGSGRRAADRGQAKLQVLSQVDTE